MSRRSMAVRGWLLLIVTLPAVPLAASQESALMRGARVAVVALHDSRLLILCPVFGRDVIASSLWTRGMEATVTVVYPFEGVQALGLHFGSQLGSRVTLPLPASAPPGAAAGQAVAPGVRELDRLAPDVEVQRRAEQAFLKLKAYVIVESPADADFVFLLESICSPIAVGTTPPPPAPLDAESVRRTRPSHFRSNITLVNVPVTVDRPGHTVRARQGYRAGTGQAGGPPPGASGPRTVEVMTKPGQPWTPRPTGTMADLPPLPADSDLDTYGGLRTMKGKATGFFRAAGQGRGRSRSRRHILQRVPETGEVSCSAATAFEDPWP